MASVERLVQERVRRSFSSKRLLGAFEVRTVLAEWQWRAWDSRADVMANAFLLLSLSVCLSTLSECLQCTIANIALAPRNEDAPKEVHGRADTEDTFPI